MFCRPVQDPHTITRIGLIFMILAGLSRWFLHPSAHLSDRVVDATTGLLYGITIGSLLLGMWLKARRRKWTRTKSCSQFRISIKG